MQHILGRFVHALREQGLPISPPETLDALHTTELLGVSDRTQLKQALSLVLVKQQNQRADYDRLFDQFFATQADAPQEPTIAPSVEPSAQDSATAASPNSNNAADAANQNAADEQTTAQANTAPADNNAIQSPLGQQLLQADIAAMQVAIANTGQQAGAMEMQMFTQRGVVAQRMMRLLGDDALRQELLELMAQPEQQPLLETLQQQRSRLRANINDYVEQQYLLYSSNKGQQLRDDALLQVKMGHIERQQQQQMAVLIRRVAKQLATLHRRRRKISKRGQLDVRRTISANAAYDGMLFHTHWKQTRIERPKLLVLCDISGSMSRYSYFLLLFVYCLQEVLAGVRSFVFTSTLHEVTDELKHRDIEEALSLIMSNRANGSTHYGIALRDFEQQALTTIDQRTTVIMLGDARNNSAEPEADIWREVYQRSKRVLWLNPESKGLWNSGDSVVAAYQPYCSRMESCQSLRDLSRIFSDLLKYQ